MTSRETEQIASPKRRSAQPARAPAAAQRSTAATAAARSRIPLPAALLARLPAAASGVVAPVGVGLNVQALRDWALDLGWTVSEDPPAPGRTQWIWCPARRSDLTRLAAEHADALVLSDHDLLLGADDWAAALPDQSKAQALATQQATGGWPAALPLARALPGDAQPHLHPMAATLLGPLLPPAPLLAAARVLAGPALVTPAVAQALGVARADLQALHDAGWLWHEPQGWVFPQTMRRLLCPHPDVDAARLAARALADDGRSAAALQTLADGGAWSDYLLLLASSARAAHGEAALRAALSPLPERWRGEPPALYVAGLLARAVADLPAAAELYDRALKAGLAAPLAAQAHNARGVVHAMVGDVTSALADFEQAATAGGLTAGEACRNRATLLVQLGRHDEAQTSLQGAVAAFREAGDLLREARSLETLGSLQFGRGLLREALAAYHKALELLLPQQPDDGAMILLNLAECHVWLGEPEAAQGRLREAGQLGEIVASAQIGGWLGRVQALVHLQAGEPALALALLDHVQADEDQALKAEAALLRTRALREQGQHDAAVAAWQEARSLGLRADLEAALLQQAALDDVIDTARREQARLELAIALLQRARTDDLAEALQLIRSHGYLALLDSPSAAPLAALADDAATRALFPLRLQTLGPLRVSHAGRSLQLVDFAARKSAALLVALALARQPQAREQLAERFWPEAKNPLASLQTAVYHLRAAFGVPVIGSERGLLTLLFPVETDVAALETALRGSDVKTLATLLRRITLPAHFLPDLPAELEDERAHAERVLLDVLRAHADAQPASDVRRRDALRALLATDPLDTDSREELVRWHERRGETELAAQEQRLLKEALNALGL